METSIFDDKHPHGDRYEAVWLAGGQDGLNAIDSFVLNGEEIDAAREKTMAFLQKRGKISKGLLSLLDSA